MGFLVILNGKDPGYHDKVNRGGAAGPITYGYDNNGNRTSATNGGMTTTYAYDGVDRLTRINYPQPGTPYSTYEYNGDGLRVKVREKTGLTTRYVWSDSDVINEYTDTWTLLKSYYLGGGLEGLIAGTTYSYYHPDGLGSIMKITGATGTITDSYDFDEFGTQIMSQGTTPNAYRYTGQQSDADSGLLYLRARYYEPSTGRFISQDPMKGSLIEPQSQHSYLYCQNNPINFVDPLGLCRMGSRYWNPYLKAWLFDPDRGKIKDSGKVDDISVDLYMSILVPAVMRIRAAIIASMVTGTAGTGAGVAINNLNKVTKISEILENPKILGKMTKKEVFGLAEELEKAGGGKVSRSSNGYTHIQVFGKEGGNIKYNPHANKVHHPEFSEGAYWKISGQRFGKIVIRIPALYE